MTKADDQPAPSIAEVLRYHGITPCSKCHGEGIIRSSTPALEMTAGCGHCDGTGEEPKCPLCKGTGSVLEPVPDGALTYGDRTDGLASFPCDCELIKEGVAPRARNNVSRDRANPGADDVKGQSK